MKKYLILSAAILASAFTSCKKEDEHATEATITINTPAANMMYDYGDTVFVNATISADEAMHGWMLGFTDESSNELFMVDAHEHAATYNVDTFWVNNVTATTHVTVKLTATVDHDGNEQSQEVMIHCHQQ